MPPFYYPPPNQTQPNTTNSNSVPQANVASVASTYSNSWYPDSGASHHVTNVSQNIQQVTPFEDPIKSLLEMVKVLTSIPQVLLAIAATDHLKHPHH